MVEPDSGSACLNELDAMIGRAEAPASDTANGQEKGHTSAMGCSTAQDTADHGRHVGPAASEQGQAQ